MDEKAKKNILKMIPYGLYVITTKGNAFSASWLSQCSFKPPLVMVGSQRESNSTKMILETKRFAINFVDKSQADIVKHFFKPAHLVGDKLSGYELMISNNIPILKVSLAYLECEVRDRLTIGDHTVIIAEIVSATQLREGEPLHLRDTNWSYSG